MGTPELLEIILANLPACDLLCRAPRVSKEWKASIDRSPKIQKRVFKRADPNPHTTKRFLQNMLIFPNVFNYPTLRFRGRRGPKPHINMCFNMPKNQSACRERYGSWREMQVARPPFTTLRWHVRGADEMHKRLRLPGLAVEFEFPEGLRLGDYYDLLCGTTFLQYSHAAWGPLYVGSRKICLSGDAAQRWRSERRAAADRVGIILVEQRMYSGSRVELDDREREQLSTPIDLEKFSTNLVKFERLEMVEQTEGIPWSFVEQDLDGPRRLEAMREFLRVTQTPCEPLSYSERLEYY